MSHQLPDNGQQACDHIRDRLKVLFPEMTFKVSPQNGTRAFKTILPGTIRILGQRTRNLRYDRGNYYATFDISGDDFNTADTGIGSEPMLKDAVADIQAQLRMRNQ